MPEAIYRQRCLVILASRGGSLHPPFMPHSRGAVISQTSPPHFSQTGHEATALALLHQRPPGLFPENPFFFQMAPGRILILAEASPLVPLLSRIGFWDLAWIILQDQTVAACAGARRTSMCRLSRDNVCKLGLSSFIVGEYLARVGQSQNHSCASIRTLGRNKCCWFSGTHVGPWIREISDS